MYIINNDFMSMSVIAPQMVFSVADFPLSLETAALVELRREWSRKCATDCSEALQEILHEFGRAHFTSTEHLLLTDFTKKLTATIEEFPQKVQTLPQFMSGEGIASLKTEFRELFNRRCFTLLLQLQREQIKEISTELSLLPATLSTLCERMELLDEPRLAHFTRLSAGQGSDPVELLKKEAMKIKQQNALFAKFYKLAKDNPAEHLDHAQAANGQKGRFVEDLMLGTGLCLGACLDFARLKLKSDGVAVHGIQPTARARFFEAAHYMAIRTPLPSAIKQALHKLKTEPHTRYDACVIANDILAALQQHEIEESQFRVVNKEAFAQLKKIGDVDPDSIELQPYLDGLLTAVAACPKNIVKPLGYLIDDALLKRHGIHSKEVLGGKITQEMPLDAFLKGLSVSSIEQLIDTKLGGNVIVLMGPPIHAIYCKLTPPYEIHDVNYPGCVDFRTDELEEFKLYMLFWAASYNQPTWYANVQRALHITAQ